jgi:hypothetical protein
MSVGHFTDKKHQPSPDDIVIAIGEGLPDWENFSAFLRTTYTIQETWKFMYGKKYGWALHFERDRKMLVNLYPTLGGFTVQINLPETTVLAALALDLPPHIREAIETAFPFPEGRWIFIPCLEPSDLPKLKKLVELRVASRLDKKGK